MTEDLIRRLMTAGLNKQQASSVTAETLVNLFMPDDGKVLIREAQKQVNEMKTMVANLKEEYEELKEKINQVSKTIMAVIDAQNRCGKVSDEKARNVIALYAALLGMNQRAGAAGTDAVKNAGYVLYAYLGGQAKREISYSYGPDNE